MIAALLLLALGTQLVLASRRHRTWRVASRHLLNSLGDQ